MDSYLGIQIRHSFNIYARNDLCFQSCDPSGSKPMRCLLFLNFVWLSCCIYLFKKVSGLLKIQRLCRLHLILFCRCFILYLYSSKEIFLFFHSDKICIKTTSITKENRKNFRVNCSVISSCKVERFPLDGKLLAFHATTLSETVQWLYNAYLKLFVCNFPSFV